MILPSNPNIDMNVDTLILIQLLIHYIGYMLVIYSSLLFSTEHNISVDFCKHSKHLDFEALHKSPKCVAQTKKAEQSIKMK